MESRVNAIQAIAAGMEQVKMPPRVWVQAGAVGFYGNRGDGILDERSPNGDGPGGDLPAMGRRFRLRECPENPKVLLRIGVVLGRYGGALPVLERLTRWFLGGQAGDGKQFVSWIHLKDLTRMFWESVRREDLAGTFNAVAPIR